MKNETDKLIERIRRYEYLDNRLRRLKRFLNLTRRYKNGNTRST